MQMSYTVLHGALWLGENMMGVVGKGTDGAGYHV